MKIALLSLLVAILVAVLSVFQFEKYQKFEASTSETLNQLNAKIDQIPHLQKTIQQQEQELQMLAKRNATPSWSKQEAEYLVRMASAKLTFAYDVNTAIQLLETADHSLVSLNDPTLNPIREALAADRATLKTIKLPDLEGLWLKVGALLEQVSMLPTRGLRGPHSNDETAPAPAPESTKKSDATTESSWRQSLQNTQQELKDIIKIQRHNKPIEPILSSAEQLLAKEHLYLALEQIRWAILERNNAIYQQAIKEAQTLLENHFENSDERVKNLSSELKALAEINLKPKLPSLEQTLQRLLDKG